MKFICQNIAFVKQPGHKVFAQYYFGGHNLCCRVMVLCMLMPPDIV